jgi:AcrR family transcriptional regulator
MKKTDTKKQEIIEKAADHLLGRGMKEATLRKLAGAAGMSDRMLLHYFTDKEDLLTAALTCVTERLVQLLNSARSEPMPFEKLLPYLSAMMNNPLVRPYLRLSLELAAMSASGEQAYRAIAQKICRDFLLWVASALEVDKEEERVPMAALSFAITEGFMVLDALGSDSIITSALEALAGYERHPPGGPQT